MIERLVRRIREKRASKEQLKGVRGQIGSLIGQIFNEPLVTKYSFTFKEGLESWENDFLNLLVSNPELAGKSMVEIGIEKRDASWPDRGNMYDMTLRFGSTLPFLLTNFFYFPDSMTQLQYLPGKTKIFSGITINNSSKISKTDADGKREFFRLDIIKGVVSKV